MVIVQNEANPDGFELPAAHRDRMRAKAPSRGMLASVGRSPAIVAVFVALIALGAGCAAGTSGGSSGGSNGRPPAPPSADEMDSRVQALTDLFITRAAQAFEDLENTSDDRQVRSWARTSKLYQTLAAMAIATGPNPYGNALDL